MELIFIQMAISTKENGTMTCKMRLAHIVTLMEMFIKASGTTVNSMEMETTSTKTEKLYIREIGNKGKNMISDN